jgi:SAM-dependent methyltransferase
MSSIAGSDEGYRSRVYAAYVTARGDIPPSAVSALAPRAAYLRRMIRYHFPADRDARIVELGCGYGALIYFAGKAGYRSIEGVDRSREQVAVAKRLNIGGVREGDLMEALSSIPAGSRDAVVAFDVIEHFRKHEITALVDEVFRVLRPKGRFLIHTPNGESPFGSRMRYGDFTHEIAFTRESLGQVLLSSGFSSVNCYEDSPAPHGIKSSIRWLLWKGIRTVLRLWLAVETGDPASQAIFSQNFLAVAVK